MTGEIDFLQIVYTNQESFKNVFEGDGDVSDKNNEDYKSGNIKTDDVLVINFGKEPVVPFEGEIETLTENIDVLSREISSAHNRTEAYKGMIKIDKYFRGLDPGGKGAKAGNSMGAARNEADSVRMVKRRDELEQRRGALLEQQNIYRPNSESGIPRGTPIPSGPIPPGTGI